MPIRDWSQTAGSNTTLEGINVAEGLMNISDFNNVLRALAAAVREVQANATIASGATVAIGAANAEFLDVSGVTTITAFDTMAAGVYRVLRFAGNLTLTHNATTLILPSGANIVTDTGDVAAFRSLGAGNWRCEHYQRADGTALIAAGVGTITMGQLEGGTANPTANHYYGTNGAASKGFYPLSGYTVTTTQLDGGAASPGNTKYYGTNGSGTKGFHALPVLGTQYPRKAVVTTVGSTNWTVPTGVTEAKVTVVGGGGAGGGTGGGAAYGGGGGGGGGAAIAWVTGLTPGAPVNCTVGGEGTISYFGAVGSPYARATGGENGVANSPNGNGGAGGIGNVGDILIGGSGGGAGFISGTLLVSGAGGASMLGGGGKGLTGTATNAAGIAGQNYGGGGGGAYSTAGNARSGGGGAQGVIIIEYIEA